MSIGLFVISTFKRRVLIPPCGAGVEAVDGKSETVIDSWFVLRCGGDVAPILYTN
jgi:hypothetical protein